MLDENFIKGYPASQKAQKQRGTLDFNLAPSELSYHWAVMYSACQVSNSASSAVKPTSTADQHFEPVSMAQDSALKVF